MGKTAEQRWRRLGDEQAIRDVLARYWRGVDRQDAELVASTYEPGAYDDHGYYKGPVEGFVETLGPGVWAYFANTQHFSGHIRVEFEAEDRARVESYAEAHHIRRQEDGSVDDLVYGLRYVDDFRCRDEQWRIAHRVCTWDWHRVDPITPIPLPESYFRGRHDRSDPVYQHPIGDGRRVSPVDLVAKHACLQTLTRYTRGVDRCDPGLVRSAYFPGAYDDHGGYQGDVEGFVDWVQPTVMAAFDCTMHKLGNVLIEVDGDRAFAETYAIAHHVQAQTSPASDMIMGVRYIDRLEQREGIWKIAHRAMSFEWERAIEIASQDGPEGFQRGRRDGRDRVLAWPSSVVVKDAFADSIDEKALERVADEVTIRDQLVQYCRGVDRRDDALVRGAYHADATDDHGAYRGGVAGLIDFIHDEVHARFRTTMHKLGQSLIETGIDGDEDRASSETYAICHHVRAEEGRDVDDLVMGIRYLDTWARRAGRWGIVDRVLCLEWLRTDRLEELDASWTLGRADAGDPVFAQSL